MPSTLRMSAAAGRAREAGLRFATVPTLTQAEMQVAADEARSAGRPLVVHAATPEGMRRAVLAGAQTIEHGYYGTAEVLS